MLASEILFNSKKSPSQKNDIISSKLMIQANMVQMLSAGIYQWLPIGNIVLNKVKNIVQKHMQKISKEIILPLVQPASIWEKSKRIHKFGPELLKFKDRHMRDFVLGPTHEEVIMELISKNLQSYKQLPFCFYQIQNKFRDEIRPRFGIMRAREFLMKDAYSFHADKDCLEKNYQLFYQAYSDILSEIGLDFRAVKADSGAIGGAKSHEFHVLAKTGEDEIAISDESNFAANVEIANAPVITPTKNDVKIEIYFHKESKNHFVLSCLKEHDFNYIKIEKEILKLLKSNELKAQDTAINIDKTKILENLHNLNLPTFLDKSLETLSILKHTNKEKDYLFKFDELKNKHFFDLRNIKENEPSPDKKGKVKIKRGIEVGHIFELGDTYSKSMDVSFQDKIGKKSYMQMGCYGIGVSRIVASAIEQNHDEKGIIWPVSIAPFQVIIVPINMKKISLVKQEAFAVYDLLQKQKISVFLDDREQNMGQMLKDAELVGAPFILILGQKTIALGNYEILERKTNEKKLIKKEVLLEFLQS